MTRLEYEVTQQDYANALLHYHKNILPAILRSPKQPDRSASVQAIMRISHFIILLGEIIFAIASLFFGMCLIWWLFILFFSGSADANSIWYFMVFSAVSLSMFLFLHFERQELTLTWTKKGIRKTILNGLKSGALDSQYFGLHILKLDESRLRIEYGTTYSENCFSGIEDVIKYPEGIMILFNKAVFGIIPSSAFENAENLNAFYNDLHARLLEPESGNVIDPDGSCHSLYSFVFTWDKKEFQKVTAKAARLLYLTKQGWNNTRIILAVMSVFLLGMACCNTFLMATEYNEQSSLSGILIFLALLIQCRPLLCNVLLSGIGSKMMIDNGTVPPEYFDKQVLCFQEDRVTGFLKYSRGEILFSQIACIKQDRKNVYVYLKKEPVHQRIYVIPCSAFASPGQKDEFIQFLKSRIW